MEEQKQTRQRKKPVNIYEPVPYEKIKLEIKGYEKNQPIFEEIKVMKELVLSQYDANILNGQERNSLVRYKKK